MKRKKISEACGSATRNEDAEARQVEIQHSSCSITNVPSHILAAILFRLPIKEIVFCKCLCKSMYVTISNPKFAQSEVFPIVRILNYQNVSRILCPLKLEQDERSIDIFPTQQWHDFSEICEVSMKLDSKLKIPVRNFPMVLKDGIDGNEEITLKEKDHGYKVVNSCNGLLCLSEPFSYYHKPVVVCNPITGEFINLPLVADLVRYEHYIDCGFGYSPKTNQYKVVRIFELCLPPDYESFSGIAQVHIIGTESWKNIEYAPDSCCTLTFPTYLNGAIHWLCYRNYNEELINMVSFDCEQECFIPFSSPPLRGEGYKENVGMGVLGGCLCICDSSSQISICVWVMKNYGGGNYWTQVFEIDMSCSSILLYGSYQPIKYMSNGALLMFNYPRTDIIYYDPRKGQVKIFEFHRIRSQFEIVAHTPSFASLEAVLAGCNVEVLNVYSRCGGLKVKGEDRAISLYEKTDIGVHDDYKFEYLYHGQAPTEEYWWGRYEYPYSKVWVKP